MCNVGRVNKNNFYHYLIKVKLNIQQYEQYWLKLDQAFRKYHREIIELELE